MKNTELEKKFKVEKKNLLVSENRLKEAMKSNRSYTNDEIEILKRELVRDKAAYHETLCKLQEAIKRISDKMSRRIAEDYYIKEYSQEDLADIYGCSVSTIKKKLQKAREQMNMNKDN